MKKIAKLKLRKETIRRMQSSAARATQIAGRIAIRVSPIALAGVASCDFTRLCSA